MAVDDGRPVVDIDDPSSWPLRFAERVHEWLMITEAMPRRSVTCRSTNTKRSWSANSRVTRCACTNPLIKSVLILQGLSDRCSSYRALSPPFG